MAALLAFQSAPFQAAIKAITFICSMPAIQAQTCMINVFECLFFSVVDREIFSSHLPPSFFFCLIRILGLKK